jgi:hypothetical protein
VHVCVCVFTRVDECDSRFIHHGIEVGTVSPTAVFSPGHSQPHMMLAGLKVDLRIVVPKTVY